MEKLKIAGAWSGVLELELQVWTVSMLREEVAKRASCGPESINLIWSGKLLKDENLKLIELGIKNNGKVLATRVCSDQGKSLKEEFMAEEERSSRLARVKAAAIALSKRHAAGSLPVEDFNIELEDQSGQKVHLGSETDQRAVMMGLMLHANAKQMIKKENYKDALEVLSMGEIINSSSSLAQVELAFEKPNTLLRLSLYATPKVIELVDNVPILQIDMVWCYFMLRDIRWLSEAGIRLAKAREGIERSHGKDASRVRVLQNGRYPELALHLRLELLEGVVSFHSGQFEKSKKVLTSAQAKYFQLQVPDEALSLLMSMGYKERNSKRALRMSNQQLDLAIDFLVEEKAKKEKKREEDIQRRNEIMEQKRYGMTPLRKAVDLQSLHMLVSIGFEKELAAEALRRNENDTQKALDDLTNPETNSAIQLDIESRKRKRQRQANEAAIEELISMGLKDQKTFGTKEQALNALLGTAKTNPTAPDDSNVIPSGSMPDEASLGSWSEVGDAGGSSSAKKGEERDLEMEDELAEDLRNGDAFSDYDMEVTKEGEAINEYLTLLASADQSEKASSSR
ncbi:NEDD8 ultimate buster 1 [Vitis vinifera]|uniref:NEDD8 ultimate buster 1 n=1 Tax=Vitis vinifera TaxID=29760 RepID=A0A438E845_VITVI|nr:NEDD8 ultimate buster 1 [Vitis vinifera]